MCKQRACSQVSSGLSRLQRITRDEALSPEVVRAFMKAKEQFNIGKALMKHELEKKSLAKEKEKADLMYGFHDTQAGAKDSELAALLAASDSPKMGSEEAGEEDGGPLSQKSAGSASSYYSGPTQQMGEDKPDDAEERQG